jgi:hypothetical protein
VSAVLKARLILKSKTTPASVHDSQVFKELLDQKDQAVLADSAYHRTEQEAHLIKLIEQEFLIRLARLNNRPITPSAGCACGWWASSRG